MKYEDLIGGYKPANAQERLLVQEVASTWQRLEDCRERERLFFSLMRAKEGLSDKPGTEVLMWFDKPHKAYDQITRAIRDADLAFHRAILRIESVIDRRLRRKSEPTPAPAQLILVPEPKPRTMAAGASVTPPIPESYPHPNIRSA